MQNKMVRYILENKNSLIYLDQGLTAAFQGGGVMRTIFTKRVLTMVETCFWCLSQSFWAWEIHCSACNYKKGLGSLK